MKKSFRAYIKRVYHDTIIGYWLFNPIKKLYKFFSPRILPERIYFKQTFKNTFGYNLNLNNPKTFNEKILWLLQNDRTPLHTLCTDKYAVREYVIEKIGKQHLIPLVFKTENPTDIIPSNLPDYPIIIKTNHGCGGHIIVKNKSKINWEILQKHFKKSLKRNFYYHTREWQYKNIEPCIIVEKLLLNDQFNAPFEYKYFCVNGKISFSIIIMDKHKNTKVNYYDSNWNLINYGDQIDIKYSPTQLRTLNKMQSLVEILASDFRFVRVDLYLVGRSIYFGELTFSPSAGNEIFDPPKWDRVFGDKLNL